MPSPARDPSGAIAAAEANLKQDGTVPANASFRGLTAWAQAMGGRVAVCGQTDPFPSDPGLFVPFVSVIKRGTPVPVDRFIGKSTDDADRVYEAITGYCFEQGGPVPALTASPFPIPPLPNSASPSGASAAGPSTPASPSSARPAFIAPDRSNSTGPSNLPEMHGTPSSGTVTMRQDGNLHETPQGLTVRVLPAGTVLHVFASAPGGWLQVGDAAPEGWVHDSMVGP